MKRIFSLVYLICLTTSLPFIVLGQTSEGVGINTTTIDPHAVLDIRNTGSGIPKGVKLPFLPASSATQDMNGANPGIMFFDSESNQLFNSIEVDASTYEWDPAGWGMRGTPNTDVNKHWIGTTDNKGFNIGTNNSLRIRVRANGKVGIGLTNPVELLEVNGAIKIGSADNSNPGTIQWTGNDLELYKDSGWVSLTNTSSGDDDWLIGNSIYNLTYNIGIGTGSPSNKLGVAGGVAIGSSYASTSTTATNGLNVEGNVGIGTGGTNTYQLYLAGTTGETHSRGFFNTQTGSPSGTGYGIYNYNNMNSSFAVYGIYNKIESAATSTKYGIYNYIKGNSASSSVMYGFMQYVYNEGSGNTYGLRLLNYATGSGTDYGIYSSGEDINYFEGDLGIGDASPDGKLEVRQTGTADIFNLYDGSTNVFSVLDGGDLWADATTTFYVDASANEVGIGDASPDGKLEVRQTGTADIFNLYDGSTNVFSVLNGGDLWADATTTFYIDASTNRVGIGTSSPSAKLELRGTGAMMQIENSTTSHAWELYTGGGVGNDGLGIYDRTNSSYRLAINDAGYVGLGGVTAPLSDLHIQQSGGSSSNQQTGGINLVSALNSNYHWRIYNSSPWIRFNYSSDGGGTYTPKSYINNSDGSYNVVSDASVKKDIEPIGEVMSKIKQLKPLQYHYIDNQEKDPLAMGFLAQEVQPLFPNAVSQENENAILGIDYSKFAVISIKAIQEQQEMIEKQQEEINLMKQELERLKER